jgi:excisionase family DNA binding protein
MQTRQPELPKLLFTVAEAAARLGVGRTTLYALIADGSLCPVRIGRLTRFTAGELDRFVAQLGHRAGAAAGQ